LDSIDAAEAKDAKLSCDGDVFLLKASDGDDFRVKASDGDDFRVKDIKLSCDVDLAKGKDSKLSLLSCDVCLAGADGVVGDVFRSKDDDGDDFRSKSDDVDDFRSTELNVSLDAERLRKKVPGMSHLIDTSVDSDAWRMNVSHISSWSDAS
jgi:predicted molibdopterin-dependent oxidoreductase YjgC